MLNNVDPHLWGKYYWGTIYYLIFAYPTNPTNEDKNNVRTFFLLLKNILPCEKCRVHYQKNLITYPLTDDILDNRDKLINWIQTVNNEVNQRLNKPIVKFNQMIEMFNATNSQNFNYNNDWIIMLVILIIVILIIVYIKSQ